MLDQSTATRVWLSAAALALAAGQGYGQDIRKAISDEMLTVSGELDYAGTRLMETCGEAWQFDNLRPTVQREKFPQGTPFKPPAGPVVHISPGSARYQRLVGDMLYWAALCDYRKMRLAELQTEERAVAAEGGRVLDEAMRERNYSAHRGCDMARAEYRRACAWAWCFANMRSKEHQPGFEPATIINPFIPVPRVHLSPASPDHRKIVQSQEYWKKSVATWEPLVARLATRPLPCKAPAGAAAEHKPQGGRAAALRDELEDAMRQWWSVVDELEIGNALRNDARQIAARLQEEANQLQQTIAELNAQKQMAEDAAWRASIDAQIAVVQLALARKQAELGQVHQAVAQIDARLQAVRQDPRELLKHVDGLALKWLELCDLFGEEGPEVHRRRVAVLTQWIDEGHGLWHVYFARGCSHLHAGMHQAAMSDLDLVVTRLRQSDPRPPMLAFVAMLEAFAWNRQQNQRKADAKVGEAYKLDSRSAAVLAMRGQIYLERGQNGNAQRDLKMARQLAERNPVENQLGVLALRLLDGRDR